MLNNSANFAHSEMGDLFGRSFIKEMVRSTDTVRKLSSISEPDRPAKTSSHVRGKHRSSEQPRSLEHPHFRGNGQSFAPAEAGGYGGASGYGGPSGYGGASNYGSGTTGGYQRPSTSDWSSNNSRGRGSDGRGRGGYVKSISTLTLTAPPLLTALNPVSGVDLATILRKRRAEPHVVAPVAGRIAIFAANWRLITEDPWVLAVVGEGYRLGWLVRAPQHQSRSCSSTRYI